MTRIQLNEFGETRYDRHCLISWWDQERLSNAKVIVAGAGALGNEVLKVLSLIGIGNILIIDFDTISLSNLSRTVLFREADIGKSKAKVAAERIREIAPSVQVEFIHGDLRTDLGLGEFKTADLVFGCLDSVNARWALNRKCMRAGVEWIDGGISEFHGSVSRYSPNEGACYECNFSEQTYQRFNRRYSCPFGLVNAMEEPKVPTTAVTASIIAAYQVQQGLFILHGIDEGLFPGERLMIYLKPFRLIKDKLPINSSCLAHGSIPEDIRMVDYQEKTTFRELIIQTGCSLSSLRHIVLPYEVVTKFVCEFCGNEEMIMQPKEKVYQHQAKCPTCRQMRIPQTIDKIEPSSSFMDATIGEFQVPKKEILEIVEENRSIFVQIGQ